MELTNQWYVNIKWIWVLWPNKVHKYEQVMDEWITNENEGILPKKGGWNGRAKEAKGAEIV